MNLVKRGQAAAGAAVFLVIVTALIVGFILLLPPADRAELLGDSSNKSLASTLSKDIEDTVPEKTLLQQSPGRIDYLTQKEIEHPLPVVNIFTKTESKVLATKSIVNTKRGVFTDEKVEFPFTIGDIAHTENFLLNFKVLDIAGDLVVSLNGEEIYKNKPTKGGSQIISLPKNSLQTSNVLVFSSSSPGVAFWRTHGASLEGLQIVADVTSVEAQTSKNIFLVSETEKENLKGVTLKFKPECEFSQVGKLRITLNGKEIYYGIPDCELSFVTIEFDPAEVLQGQNELVFKTEKGTYVLAGVVVESELKEVDFPTYYVELSEEEYNSVFKTKTRRIRLTLDFVDVVVSKQGSLVFNGHVYNFDTKEASFVVDLSEDVVRGINAIKIKPKKTLEIRELRIELVK